MGNFTKLTAIKFVELTLVIVLFILVLTQGGSYEAESSLHFGTFMAYLIILIGVVGGSLAGSPVPGKIDLYFSAVGATLFILIGITIFNHHGNTAATTKGVLCIIDGILFIVDAFMTFKES